MQVISTKDLTKFYGDQVGVKNLNLSVNEGEIFGFVGPNGAGKSTAIRTFLGLLKPTSGSASIFGKDIIKNGPTIRQQIGYLPSEVFYYPEMNSREMLEYHLRFYPEGNHHNINELADFFELNLDKSIADLSFGNKKKCAIIQCFLHKPKLLILDEPTSGLDPLMQNRFFEFLQEQNNKGATVFMSSHILSEIQRMCDRAAVIKNGEIIAVETINELLSKQLKKVTLIFKEAPTDVQTPDSFLNKNLHHQKMTFEFKGQLHELLSWLNNQPIQDITIEEPDLESIFMNYYQR